MNNVDRLLPDIVIKLVQAKKSHISEEKLNTAISLACLNAKTR